MEGWPGQSDDERGERNCRTGQPSRAACRVYRLPVLLLFTLPLQFLQALHVQERRMPQYGLPHE